MDFVEEFIWLSPVVPISIDVWADEAIEHVWINKVTPCSCAR